MAGQHTARGTVRGGKRSRSLEDDLRESSIFFLGGLGSSSGKAERDARSKPSLSCTRTVFLPPHLSLFLSARTHARTHTVSCRARFCALGKTRGDTMQAFRKTIGKSVEPSDDRSQSLRKKLNPCDAMDTRRCLTPPDIEKSSARLVTSPPSNRIAMLSSHFA